MATRPAPAHRRERLWSVVTVVVVVAALSGLVLVTKPWQRSPVAVQASRQPIAPSPGHEEGSRPRSVPVVSDGAFGYLHLQPDGHAPVTYSPCRPIHYVVRSAGAPAGGRGLITAAVASVATQTGLRFVDDGATTEAIAQDRPAYQPDRYGDRWAPVLIAWATPAEVPDFGVDIVAEAGSQRMIRPDGQYTYVTGTVTLSPVAITQMMASFGPGAGRAVIQHELGHLVGLDHVSDTRELMFPRAQNGLADFGPGDLAGLARVGAGACVPDL